MNIRKYYLRGRHPHGFWGNRALKEMNDKKHAAMPEWVFGELKLNEDARILDLGCGGGANIARMLEKCPKGTVTGLDISQLALEKSKELNYHAYVDKRCMISGGNAVQLPLARGMYDVVTAFETIYFWSSLTAGAEEMFRVLKPGGMCVIANELDGLQQSDRDLEKNPGAMRVYTIDEIKEDLSAAGFTNIQSRHDEERHFICVTARKP